MAFITQLPDFIQCPGGCPVITETTPNRLATPKAFQQVGTPRCEIVTDYGSPIATTVVDSDYHPAPNLVRKSGSDEEHTLSQPDLGQLWRYADIDTGQVVRWESISWVNGPIDPEGSELAVAAQLYAPFARGWLLKVGVNLGGGQTRELLVGIEPGRPYTLNQARQELPLPEHLFEPHELLVALLGQARLDLVAHGGAKPASALTVEQILELELPRMEIGGLILPTGDYSLLAGPPGSGKTWTALYLTHHALQQGFRVLYVNHEGGLLRRIQELPDDYLAGPLLVTEQVAGWEHHAEEHKPDLYIFDAYADLLPLGASENDTDIANLFIQQLQTRLGSNRSAVVIHHTLKSDPSVPRGAGRLIDAARLILSQHESEPDSNEFELRVRKDTNFNYQVALGRVVMTLSIQNNTPKRQTGTSEGEDPATGAYRRGEF